MQFLKQVQMVALCIFFFSINFEMFEPFSSITWSVSRFTGILYFVTLIPEIKFFLRTDRIGNILLTIWIFFGFLTLMSLLNINEVSKEYFNISIFQNILLFWFLANHARKDYLILEKGMLFFALGTIVFSIMYIIGYGVEYEEGRLTMFKENQNALGISMCIGIMILLLFVVQNKIQLGRWRYLFLAFLPLMVVFLFETGSRKAFLSLVASFITGVILLKTNKISGKLVAMLLGMLGLIALGILLMQSDVLRDRLLDTAQKGDLSQRDVIWSKVMPTIIENPFFGVGNTGYDLYSVITFGGTMMSPHNVILEVLSLTGITGLLIYFTYLYQVLMRSYKAYTTNGLLLPILLSFPMLSLIVSGQILTSKLGWIIFAYSVGSNAIKIRPPENEIS